MVSGPRLDGAGRSAPGARAIGEDVTQEELGGARVHCRKSGVGDLEVADDEECIARIREYLSVLPVQLRAGPRRCGP
jgi:acetyl-CoA carboxylase carboxyltransferase component